jgi:hypothetical protein
MITEYELYSDEREHRNASGQKHLLLGGVVCTDNGGERLREALSKVRAKFSLSDEMRWAKVSKAYLDAYKEWIGVFFDHEYARFSLLRVDLSSREWAGFRPSSDKRPTRDNKLASVFYQFLLVTFGPLRDTKRWWVYPDAGFYSRDEVLGRVEFLFNRTYKKAFGSKTSRIIRLARARDSRSEDLIQLSDVLLAAAGCDRLGPLPSSPAKKSLVEYWQERYREAPNTKKGFERLSERIWVPPDRFAYSR